MKRLMIMGLCICLSVLMVSLNLFAEEPVLMMATTTSTDNTGLLDFLAPEFKKATGIEVLWTATGTGKALKLGENCDVDLLMVHAPTAEKKFVDSGNGIHRREVMVNDFVIIGPESDPGRIKGKSIKEALTALRASSTVFVSRGDNSGTHKKELSLWQSARLAVPEKERWYVQTGQGMLATINIAAERQGYTMTDRGTYIKYEDNLKGSTTLGIMVEGGPELMNQYSVIAINPDRCSRVKSDLALRFINWIVQPEGQEQIGNFKLLGKPLFTPNAKP
jgi:tungstate transport system substrate-binding protein